MTVTEKLEELSKRVWADIKLADRYSIFRGEETITDSLLLEIAKENFSGIKVIQTIKKKEAEQGTDWEWYIGNSEYGWMRYAVQAKKLSVRSSVYDSLRHKVGLTPNDKYQIDILREFSRVNGHVPLYNFYNYYPLATERDHWHCYRPFDKELLGWTFTPLKNIETAVRVKGSRSFDKIHSLSDTFPIRCLFSCPLFFSFYMNRDLFDIPGTFLGEPFRKIRVLPQELIIGRETGVLRSFPEELYDRQLGLFPKRIAIIELLDIQLSDIK